ncbi:MAG: hypothetical protein AB7N76_35815 [Planctomycetota bacterium]
MCEVGLRATVTVGGKQITVEVERPLPGFDDELLLLRFVGPEGHEAQHVGVTYSAATFGRRRWFVCPVCARRCAVLYLPPGASAFRCRRCHELSYRVQQRRSRPFRIGRAQHQLDRVRRQLVRPRLRRSTRARLAERVRDVSVR